MARTLCGWKRSATNSTKNNSGEPGELAKRISGGLLQETRSKAAWIWGATSGLFGIRSHLPVTMGVPSIGGSVTTRGGLVFIGAAVDSMFRAFDTATGEQLWQSSLPGAGMATPMTYQSSRSGRQFVVIAAGGRPALNTRLRKSSPPSWQFARSHVFKKPVPFRSVLEDLRWHF
jgi:hypothetical protein